jgi:predicted transcriptional regulator
MDNLENKILRIFEDLKVARDGVLLDRSLLIKISKFPRKDQDKSSHAIQSLVDSGYLKQDDSGYFLTSLGFDLLYKHIDIEKTENEIMTCFVKKNLGLSEILLYQVLATSDVLSHPKHKENFDAALENLTNKAFVERTEPGLKLLKAGYDHIY